MSIRPLLRCGVLIVLVALAACSAGPTTESTVVPSPTRAGTAITFGQSAIGASAFVTQTPVPSPSARPASPIVAASAAATVAATVTAPRPVATATSVPTRQAPATPKPATPTVAPVRTTTATVPKGSPATPVAPTPASEIAYPQFFVDAAQGGYFWIQLKEGEFDYGQCAVAIPGFGLIVPKERVQFSANTPTAVQFAYDGLAFHSANAKLSTLSPLFTQAGNDLETIPVVMTASLDPQAGTGTITVRAQGQQFTVASVVPPATYAQTVEEIAAAWLAGDIDRLYEHFTRQLRTLFPIEETRAQFAQQGPFKSVTVVVAPIYQPGIHQVVAMYEVVRIADGQEVTEKMGVALAYEDDAWRVMTFMPENPQFK